jgi:hypothetical protein
MRIINLASSYLIPGSIDKDNVHVEVSSIRVHSTWSHLEYQYVGYLQDLVIARTISLFQHDSGALRCSNGEYKSTYESGGVDRAGTTERQAMFAICKFLIQKYLGIRGHLS